MADSGERPVADRRTLAKAGAVAAAVAVAALAVAMLAGAATGELTYKDCITGEAESGPGGSGACDEIPDAATGGGDSGLGELGSMGLSADGKSLYVTSEQDSAVARFKRDTGNGALTYKGCITGETDSGPGGSGACEEVPAAAAFGETSGLGGVGALALSVNGKSLYTASEQDAAVARFKRDTGNGALTFKDCITGETESGPSGSGACEEIAGATSGGSDSGLAGLGSLTLSADGKSLYTAAEQDNAVARFKRDTDNGALTYKDCIAGSVTAGPGGTGACDEIASATDPGIQSGLNALGGLALSADGTSLYAASEGDDSVARFKREQ